MANESDRGVAYDFWKRVKSEQASRGWTDTELSGRSGIPRSTIDRLEVGKRPPASRVVNTLASVLGIDGDEARRLARVVPGPGKPGVVSTRDAVLRDPIYTESQRATMLELLDVFERVNDQDTVDRGRKAG